MGFLNPDHVIGASAYAEPQVNARRHEFAGQSHLKLTRDPTQVDDSTGGSDRSTELGGKLASDGNVRFAESRTDANNQLRRIQSRCFCAGIAFAREHFESVR